MDKDRELIRLWRKQVLDEEDKLYKTGCIPCTKIRDAINDESYPSEHIAEDGYKYSTKDNWSADRRNPICEACEYHQKIRGCGLKLERLMEYDRALR